MKKTYTEKDVATMRHALTGMLAGSNMLAHGCYSRKTPDKKIVGKWAPYKTEIEIAASVSEISRICGQYITKHSLTNAFGNDYVSIANRVYDVCSKLDGCTECCEVFKDYDGIRDDTGLFLELSSEYLQIVRNTAESFETMRKSCASEEDLIQKFYEKTFFDNVLALAASTENIFDILCLRSILGRINEGSEHWKDYLRKPHHSFMFRIHQAPDNTAPGTIHTIEA